MKSRMALIAFGMFLAAVTDSGTRAQQPYNKSQNLHQPQLLRTAVSGGAWVDPDAPPPAPTADEAFKKDTTDRLDRIEKMLKQILEEDDPGPPQGDKAETARDENVLAKGLTSCLECHNPRDAAKKGDRFVMFGGSKGNEFRDDLGAGELKRIEDRVKDGTMPKKTARVKLTPEGREAIIAEMKARRTAPANPSDR